MTFVFTNDRNHIYRYAPLQGKTAKKYLPLDMTLDLSSVILRSHTQTYKKSTAALRIIAGLGGVWRLAALGLLVPVPLRDFIYDQVAKRRYGLFGKAESCRLPLPHERVFFLD